jgi:hypothetical protein
LVGRCTRIGSGTATNGRTWTIWDRDAVGHVTSTWSAIENLTALNSAVNDIPRPPGQHGLVMPMASERDSASGGYRTYLSARPSVDQPFGATAVVTGWPPADISRRRVPERRRADDVLCARAVNGNKPDIFVAWRLTTADRFSLATPIEPQHRRRRTRSLAQPRRHDVLLHVRPRQRRAADLRSIGLAADALISELARAGPAQRRTFASASVAASSV